MEDDILASLTRQVREEVVENYLSERKLLEFQIEELYAQVERLRSLAEETGRRFTRLGFLMRDPKVLDRLLEILRIPRGSFWDGSLRKPFCGGVRFIRVTALTARTKFKKLILESYRRILPWMEEYTKKYRELQSECRAVNINIRNFHSNYDLLTILNFLRGLDIGYLEHKYFLGENFTSEELSSIDQRLYIKGVSFRQFDLPEPIEIPPIHSVEKSLIDLANRIYKAYNCEIKHLIL